MGRGRAFVRRVWGGVWGPLWRDEDAQATVEYLIMLCIAILLVGILVRELIRPALSRLADVISRRIDSILSGSGGFHRLRVGR